MFQTTNQLNMIKPMTSHAHNHDGWDSNLDVLRYMAARVSAMVGTGWGPQHS